MENIEAHYEDIESLNKLRIPYVVRNIKNCALQNVFKIYNWWHHHHGNKHMLSANMVYFFFSFPCS